MLHRNLHRDEMASLRSSLGEVTGGIFGFLRSLGKAFTMAPSGYYPIICWDSRVSQRRLDLYPNYKHYADREKEEKIENVAKMLMENPDCVDLTSLPESDVDLIKGKMSELIDLGDDYVKDEYLETYVDQRNKLIEICNNLGIPSIKIKNWEGDDLMTLLSRVSNKSIIVTDDSDLRQLISEDVSILRLMGDSAGLYDTSYIKDLGYPNSRFLTLVKAIVGDASDNVPHLINGVGSKGAEKLVKIICDNDELPDKYLPIIRDLKGKLSKFVDCHHEYLINLQLVDLSLVEDDPDVYSEIDSFIHTVVPNYIKAVKLLRHYDINVIDLDSLFNKITIAKPNLYFKKG